ncbi:hypothetical protein D5018_14170 [Parashewanella curva]|uniref:DUF6701 domain-containing protein n=1 Tax=Parashewanella curva TaxID=2338552 RepID=A0A3L8PUQ5_9GAMM|nr:DUF6701 domain-containing protein [Parashewanella curva]RLV59034.1 hypothetical protein D5018_14170 [Parashewanella curva]
MKRTKLSQFYSVVLLLFVGLCSWQSCAMDVESFLKFGKTESRKGQFGAFQEINVTFDTPFAVGTVPLIFITPTFNNANNVTSDNSSSIFITRVSNTGFSWIQRDPPSSFTFNSSKIMRDVHWLAITEGEHSFANGLKLFAGKSTKSSATNLSAGSWTRIINDPAIGYDAFLTQTQTDNNANGCWVTSVSRRIPSNFAGLVDGEINLETSEVYDDAGARYCFRRNRGTYPQPETVGYLALTKGHGSIDYNSTKTLKYQFGEGKNAANSGFYNLNAQCRHSTALQGFTDTPFLVAKKISRFGNDGGWLRRCDLSSSQVSIAVDEDTYRDSERSHTVEDFSFVALELVDKTVTPTQVHHFELGYSDNQFTCKREPITLKACADQSCTQLVDGEVLARLAPNLSANFGGWFSGENRISEIRFSNGQVPVEFEYFGTQPITLNVADSTPTAQFPTLCKKGSDAPSVAACTIQFSSSGFIFNISPEYSNKPQRFQIEAKRQNGSGRCTPMFRNRTRQVWLSTQDIDPNPRNSNIAVQAKTTTSDTYQNISSNANQPTQFSLYFNNQGIASLDLNYAEAGKMQLDIRFWNTNNINRPPSLSGSSQFVRSPVGFCFKPSESKGEYGGGFDANSAFKKAGEEFGLMITAKAWQSDSDSDFCNNLTTRNYQQQGVQLTHQLVAPAGGAKGTLKVPNFNYQQSSDGNTVNQAVSEVGVFNFTVSAPNYMNSDKSVATATSPNIGRFVPASFNFVNLVTPAVLPQCGNSLYMDQPFDLNYQITAVNTSGARTQNYTGEFAKGDMRLIALKNSQDLSARLNAKVSTTELIISAANMRWSNGQATIDTNPIFERSVSPDGPYLGYDIGIALDDKDNGIAGINGADMIPANCQDQSCRGLKLSTKPVDLYYARVFAENGYGIESSDIRSSVKIQTWDSTLDNWLDNKTDSCTTLATPNLINPQYVPSIGAGQSITREFGNNGRFDDGQLPLFWKPSSVPYYRGKVASELTVPSYLKWRWPWANPVGSDANPISNAYFGRFRGHDRVIYWREVQ